MLNSGEKKLFRTEICFRTTRELEYLFCAANKINILTLVLSENKFLNESKHHTPHPLQVKWPVPKF